jgi:hypothetical protein
MTNPNKSLLVRMVSDHADSLALKLRDFDKLQASIDKNFDASSDEKGNVTIVRKGTQQVIDGNFDQFFKLVARSHVSDLSFGKFRSQFAPRETSNEEKSMTKALLDHSKFHFTDQSKREKIEGFIMKNFVPDGNALRRLHKGQVSTTSFEPDEILMQYAKDIIDPDRSELSRLEAIAEMRDKATWLSGNEPKTAERLLKTMQKLSTPSFNPLPQDLLQKQDRDNEAQAMANLGLLDKSAATLAELNQIEIKKKLIRSEIDMLPILPNE